MNRRDLVKGMAAAGMASALGSEALARNAASGDLATGTRKGSKMRRAYLDGPYGQIHYHEQGEGPVLLMLHQSPGNGRMFERAMPHLAEAGVRAIAIDTPGFGMSDTPPAPPTITDYADALPAVLEGLGLKKAHWLGHHTGAGIAANFAARSPDAFISLTLNGPSMMSEEDLAAYADIEHGPDEKHADGSHLIKAWNRRVKFTPGWTDLDAMHRRFVDQQWAGDTAWYGHHAAFAHNSRPDLQAVSAPTLILTNTGDDIYQQAIDVHAMRPDMEYQELAGGTHDIVDEQPQAWAQTVSDYVLRHS